jgi:ABC-type polysaccharide/polyol phosphate transport system ATPase subunit
MNSAVIRAEGLGKRYKRGITWSPGLRHALERIVKSPLGGLRGKKEETFWALKDVSLEVKEGEVLGLIGRNGAGKTTLLKILSRITKPTTGWAEIHGRVGSLLEVGTGFHPELTGRENAFLSGAILGMTKSEITRKFDEIVAFAELEKFIDTPVKHYSSGMYVRLAFAVAAHLEPEILLVDEVLAVGDINFQKKCLAKMGDVARAGRTIVLVTHQMNQIRRLCHRVVWVEDGCIRLNGNTDEVAGAYESAMRRSESKGLGSRRADKKAQFFHWELVGPANDDTHVLTQIGPATVKFRVEVSQPLRRAHHGVALYNNHRQLVWGAGAYDLNLGVGVHELTYDFSSLPLSPGPYDWLVSLFDESGELDIWSAAPDLIVATKNFQHARDEWIGMLNLPSKFSIQLVKD